MFCRCSGCIRSARNYKMCIRDRLSWARGASLATRSVTVPPYSRNSSAGADVYKRQPYNRSAAVGAKLKDQDYRAADIGLAVSQLVYRAHELGLSTCCLLYTSQSFVDCQAF